MKLTSKKLKEIIKEEIGKITEMMPPEPLDPSSFQGGEHMYPGSALKQKVQTDWLPEVEELLNSVPGGTPEYAKLLGLEQAMVTFLTGKKY